MNATNPVSSCDCFMQGLESLYLSIRMSCISTVDKTVAVTLASSKCARCNCAVSSQTTFRQHPLRMSSQRDR